jgi:hypothetical protein
MILREGRQLNGFFAPDLARREDANKVRAVALNMVDYNFHTFDCRHQLITAVCTVYV